MSDLEFESGEWLSDEEVEPTGDLKPQKSYSLDDIWQKQFKTATLTCDALQVNVDICFIFLHKRKWQQQELVNSFILDPDIFPKYEAPRLTNVRSVVCPLCVERSAGVHLGCGHAVCVDCFEEYIRHKISEHQLYPMKCPGDAACMRVIGPSIASSYDGYRPTSVLLYLPHTNIKGCPASNCKVYHELTGSTIPCKCGALLCGQCGYFEHDPAPCSIKDKWLNLLRDDKELLLKCTSNAKPCPKCKIVIEKQIGCNHMKCTCGYDFCWQCLGEFKNYGHQCAKFTEQPKKRNNKRRFAHYAPRYTFNLANAGYHSNVQTTSDTLDTAHNVLASSSMLIAWTFVALFYVTTHSNQRLLLENNLIDLEQACERLGTYLRDDSDRIAQTTAYVNERRKILSEFSRDFSWKFDL